MKKKVRRFHKKKQKLKHISQYFLFGAIILSIFLLGVLISEYINVDSIKNSFADPHKVELRDECSLIMGNLVHQIRDETDCSLRCHNICIVENTKFIESDFVFSNNSCHTCNCYCK